MQLEKGNKKILAMLGIGHVVTDAYQGALSLILAFLQPVFALTQIQVGFVMLAFNLSSSIIQPLFGIFSDRFRAVWLIPLGCLLGGLGMGLTGFSDSYKVVLFLVLISGLGVASYHPEGSKYARFASGKRKATGMSIFSVGGNLGFGLGPILATFLYGLAGLKGTAGLIILGALMALILVVNLKNITNTQTAIGKDEQAEAEHPKEPTKQLNKGVIFSVIVLIMIVIMRSWTHLGIVTFIPQYYMHYLHCDQVHAAFLTSIFLLAGALGTLFGGPAADHWGLKTIITCSFALQVPLLFLFANVQGIWATVVLAATGFVIISTFAVTVVMCQELLPGNVGLASGLMLGFAIGMGGVGTTLLGWVADNWGLFMVFKIIILFPAVGFILSLFLPGRKSLSMGKVLQNGHGAVSS
jgi:FSR family fosmidomycin resistance protein-like MFS transporter